MSVRFVRVFSCALIVGCVCTVARASLTLNTGTQVAVQPGNLVANSSFETAAPAPGFANQLYWASGTANTPFAVPSGWSSSGMPSTYALWGSDGIVGQGINFSAPLPDGQAGLYFGNGLMTVNQTPTFNPNGTVTFPSAPTFSPAYGGPSTLSQAINTPGNPAPSYVLNFWVSGEEAVNASSQGATWTEGIMGLRVTNVLPGDPITYLAVPSALSTNPFRRFEFNFVPLNSSLPVTVEFINWGHLGTSTPTSTELVLDDVIVNPVPEPATILLAGIPLAAVWSRWRRRA